MARRLPLAVLLVALAGCARPWLNPARDDAATLLFVTEVTPLTSVSPFVFEDGRECRNTRKIELQGAGSRKAEIRVPPGEEFTILARLKDLSYLCNIAMSFRPEPRGAYAVVIAGSGQKCKLAILRSAGAKYAPEPTARRRSWSMPLIGDFQSQCSDPAPAPVAAAAPSPGGR